MTGVLPPASCHLLAQVRHLGVGQLAVLDRGELVRDGDFVGEVGCAL
jgi:hypothetical protein